MNKEAIPAIIAGAALACLGHLICAIIPVISRMVWLAQHSGSYTPSDFQLDLTIYFRVAYALLTVGVCLLLFPRPLR